MRRDRFDGETEFGWGYRGHRAVNNRAHPVANGHSLADAEPIDRHGVPCLRAAHRDDRASSRRAELVTQVQVRHPPSMPAPRALSVPTHLETQAFGVWPSC